MAMNIYQKTKVIMLESNKCAAIYNKLAKILVESNDETLNDLIGKMRKVVSKGRVSGDFNGARNKIVAYCDLKIGMNEPKKDLKSELNALIEEYKVKMKNINSYSKDVGYEDAIEEIIKNLEELIK